MERSGRGQDGLLCEERRVRVASTSGGAGRAAAVEDCGEARAGQREYLEVLERVLTISG